MLSIFIPVAPSPISLSRSRGFGFLGGDSGFVPLCVVSFLWRMVSFLWRSEVDLVLLI